MLTNAPVHPLAAPAFASTETGVQRTGVFERCLRAIQVALCSLHGHDSVLQYESTRMFLQCTSCGSETPGWDVSPSPAFARRRNAARQPLRAAAVLSVVRKVA